MEKVPTKDRRDEFSISSIHFGDRGEWRITQRMGRYSSESDPVVWSAPFLDGDWNDPTGKPANVREAYERIIGYDPRAAGAPTFNVVEMVADGDGGHDQPCVFGNRVEGHAVYCHNESWLYAPRKCRRSQQDPKWKHEGCPGFTANPSADPAKAW